MDRDEFWQSVRAGLGDVGNITAVFAPLGIAFPGITSRHTQAFIKFLDDRWQEELAALPVFARAIQIDGKTKWFAESSTSILAAFVQSERLPSGATMGSWQVVCRELGDTGNAEAAVRAMSADHSSADVPDVDASISFLEERWQL